MTSSLNQQANDQMAILSQYYPDIYTQMAAEKGRYSCKLPFVVYLSRDLNQIFQPRNHRKHLTLAQLFYICEYDVLIMFSLFF